MASSKPACSFRNPSPTSTTRACSAYLTKAARVNAHKRTLARDWGDYTFFLNIAFLAISGFLIYIGFFKRKDVKHHKEMAPKSPLLEKVLKWIAMACYVWLVVGIILKVVVV